MQPETVSKILLIILGLVSIPGLLLVAMLSFSIIFQLLPFSISSIPGLLIMLIPLVFDILGFVAYKKTKKEPELQQKILIALTVLIIIYYIALILFGLIARPIY